MDNQKIYTTGYTGKDINDLKPMLEILDATLIDIRFVAHSKVICWRKEYLKSLLGEKYRHIANLGNRTYKEEKISIQNLQLGIDTILNFPFNIVLMCVCIKTENCHRKIIVEELNKREIQTVEVLSWKTKDGSSQANFFLYD